MDIYIYRHKKTNKRIFAFKLIDSDEYEFITTFKRQVLKNYTKK